MPASHFGYEWGARWWKTIGPRGLPAFPAVATDLSADIRRVSIRRGRQFELDRLEPGSAEIELSNLDRDYDPDYAAGPHYGSLVPMKWLDVYVKNTARWGASVRNGLLWGHVQRWKPEYPDGGGKDAVVNVTVLEVGKALALLRMTNSFASTTTDAQLIAVYNQLGLGLVYDFDVGNTTLQAWDSSDESGADIVTRIVDSERGLLFFCGQSGKWRFLNRQAAIARAGDPIAIFADDPAAGEIEYRDIGFAYEDTRIWNTVNARRRGGATQTTTDATSKASYLERVKTVDDLLITTDNEVSDYAALLLASYKDPDLRIEQLEVSLFQASQAATDNLIDLLLFDEGGDIGSGVTVRRNPPGGGATISGQYSIQAIEHDIAPDNWTMRFQLAPVTPDSFWTLGVVGLSEMGETTKIGY